MEDLRLQRNKLRHQLKQLQESADADNSCKSPLASAPDQLPESAQQIAEIIKQRNHEIAQYKAQLEILRDELDSVRSGSAGRRVLTESTSAQTTIEMDSDATQTESVDKAVKSIQTEEELAEQEANSQEASRILQSLAAITNSPLSFKDSPSLRNRKRASGRKSTSPLKAMATVHEVKKLQSILKDSQQTSPLRRLVSSVSVTLYTLMIWVVGVMMGVMLVSVLLRSGSLSTQSNDLLWSGNDFSLTADEWNAASPNNPPPLYQFFEKHEGIDDEYGQIPAAANAKSAPAKSFWQRLTSWLPSKQ
jgi:hypothetical protein